MIYNIGLNKISIFANLLIYIQIIMKKQFSKYITLFLVIFSLNSYGQQLDNSQSFGWGAGSVLTFDLSSKDIKGTIYINEDFKPVKLINYKKTYFFRYNAYKDKMEFLRDPDTLSLPNTFNSTITFVGINKTYGVYNYKERNTTGFFVVLQKGKVSLLLKETIRYYPAVYPQTGYDKYKSPKFKRERDRLFLSDENNFVTELPKKKKEVVKLFSNKLKEIESFIKKNKLNIKNKEDLITIVKYYNELILIK